jgi:hypothetical protein
LPFTQGDKQEVSSLFDLVEDGRDQLPSGGSFAELLAAVARRLGLRTPQIAGVSGSADAARVARQANFGLVVGIVGVHTREDRESGAAELHLDDVGELDLGVLRTDPWVLAYGGFDPGTRRPPRGADHARQRTPRPRRVTSQQLAAHWQRGIRLKARDPAWVTG